MLALVREFVIEEMGDERYINEVELRIPFAKHYGGMMLYGGQRLEREASSLVAYDGKCGARARCWRSLATPPCTRMVPPSVRSVAVRAHAPLNARVEHAYVRSRPCVCDG